MCRFFNDFVETVNYTGHSRIFSSLSMGGVKNNATSAVLVEASYSPWSFTVEIQGFRSAGATLVKQDYRLYRL